MADTRQIVSWAIERKCAFRNGEDWFLPHETHTHLATLRTVANADSDKRIVDGICITGWTIGHDNTGGYHDIPVSGFRIEERLGKFGGATQILGTCAECEANAKSARNMQIAGCFGYVDVWPNSPELDQQLWKVISERQLEDRLRSAFHVTTPLWYGFWIKSPLRRLQCEVLYDLLDALCDHDDPNDSDAVHFLNALKTAVNWELPLHVSLAPLGHTDLGWHTVFPHCPRCKAPAPVGRWKERYPDEQIECEACGHRFNPNEHHSSEQYECDFEATSLERQLGKDGLGELTKRFLLARGCSPTQTEQILDNERYGPLLRQIKQVRRKRRLRLNNLKRARESTPESADIPARLSFALGDHVELEMVLVPAGEFLMGSPEETENGAESPQHGVRFERPFYIGRFLVTQAQWQAVMNDSPSCHFEAADLPVDRVSWLQCQEFCDKLCDRHNRAFRLPSEAEWEYACRAGTTTKYAFGDTLSTEQANFTPMAKLFGSPPDSHLDSPQEPQELADLHLLQEADRKARPTPTGSYPPNAWGIYDMHGNVNEWCEDVWHENYEGAPTDGSTWLDGEDETPFRVVRGGWCSATEFVCASSSRQQLRADTGPQEDASDDDEEDFFAGLADLIYMPCGFRVACEA